MNFGLWRLRVTWVCIMAPSLVSGAYGGGANYVENPNQVLWKFSEEMDVPHIAWAKPLAGRKGSYRTGETIRLKAKVSRSRGAQWSSVVHVGLCDDHGEMLPWSERNMIAAMGKGEITLPSALDEKPGRYALKARDVASGVEATHKVTIVKR